MAKINSDILQPGYVGIRETRATATTQAGKTIPILATKEADGTIKLRDQDGNMLKDIDLNKLRQLKFERQSTEERIKEAVEYCKVNGINLTVRSVAAQAGVSRGTVHNYYYLLE